MASYLRKCVPGLFALVVLCGAARASAQSSFCWVGETSPTDPYNSDGKRVYFTVMPDTDQDHRAAAGSLFAQYVAKKYSVRFHGPSYCAGAGMDQRIASLKARGSTVVMTEWSPDKHQELMAELAKNPPAPPNEPAAKKTTAPPSTGQTAYEKAMAEQRPRAVTQQQLAAAAKTSVPTSKPATSTDSSVAPAAEKYSFCYTTGSPYRGAGQSHYYVTQVFSVAAADPHRATAFEVYLHAQHPQESISGNYCSTPGSMNAEESARQSYIEKQRKIPNRTIVELSWKPAS